MISRIWHGWTLPDKADDYEELLKREIFVNIGNRKIKGYKGIQLLRRKAGNEEEFITIMQFNDMESVKDFAGEDYERCVVPESARRLLSRFDEYSQHYELISEIKTNN